MSTHNFKEDSWRGARSSQCCLASRRAADETTGLDDTQLGPVLVECATWAVIKLGNMEKRQLNSYLDFTHLTQLKK